MITANSLTFIMLLVTFFLITILGGVVLSRMPKSQLKVSFLSLLFCALICLIGLIAQILFSEILNIKPIYFEYVVYIGNAFFPISILFFALTFSNTKFKIKKQYLLLFIIPIISLLVLWTNDFHHLFYKEYSIYSNSSVYGPYTFIYTSYTYILLLIGLAYLIRYSIKNSGFFSKQSLLFTIGCLCPLIINICGLFNVFPMTVYITNISFTVGIMFFALAIFKFGFLKITPIALQKIVDRMSDGYIIVDDTNIVTDFNATFLNLFGLNATELRKMPIKTLLSKLSNNKSNNADFIKKISSAQRSNQTINSTHHFANINKYFNVEISSIRSDNSYIGTLILFKDITQHKIDLQTIKDKQDILVERERLAGLGQMIGGIAHNLKTPIMSISGATEGLLDLVKEYSESIDDPEVTKADHLEIAGEMQDWLRKIQSHLSYMSDIITTVKGQAVAFADNTTFTSFTIDELIKQVNILMKHELSHSLIDLIEDIKIPRSTVVAGNINSLVQVVNNIISNAIQAYDGKEKEKINFSIYKESNTLVIQVEDFAGGISDSVKSKIFKEMTTTKGKNGTGLGLFMSYSNIKAHFNGNLRFETQPRKRNSLLYRNTGLR